MNKALRGSLVEQKLKTISKSVPASPQKSIPEEKSMHRKQTKPNSTKSSPVRTLKPTTSAAREEQWIDGPRVLKSRVSEGRAIHSLSGSGGRDKRETWVDGPRLANGHSLGGASTPGNGASAGLTSAVGGSYGFMDTHKKNMIRKWVENQSILIGKTRHYREPSRALDEARGRGSGQEDDGGVTSYANHSLQPIHIPPNKGTLCRYTNIHTLLNSHCFKVYQSIICTNQIKDISLLIFNRCASRKITVFRSGTRIR